MTEEELEKEAEEKYREVDREFMDCQDEGEIFNLAYLAGAEPREKRIAELEAQIEQLTYLHNEDVNTIKLLNKQIGKMKCCYNCKHSRTEYEHCKTDKSEKWEIKEK